jgi:DNA polymerase-3 subunit delta
MNDLRNKIYKPVYLLMGEEAYFIDKVSGYIEANVLNDAEKSFNQTVMYGNDVTVGQVIDASRRFPMMAALQVVVVKEAQSLAKIEDLEHYVKAPLKSTILVICYKNKSVDKRKALYKAVGKTGEVLETALLRDYEVTSWITEYLKEKECAIEPQAATVLAESLGTDLGKIVNELDKLMVLLPQGIKKITAEQIERNIGISKDYNTFELNGAITGMDVLKANRIIQHFEKNPKAYPLVVTLSALYGHFLKLFSLHMLKAKYRVQPIPDVEVRALGIHPYFLKEYEAAMRRYSATKVSEVISLIREFDMRSKGWNNASTSDGDLLRELVYKIMH